MLPVVQERGIAVSCYEERFLKSCFPPIRQQMSKKEAWPKAFRETDLEPVFRDICLPKSQRSLTVFDGLPTKLLHFYVFFVIILIATKLTRAQLT